MIPKFVRTLLTSSGRTPYTIDWPTVEVPPPITVDLARASIGPLALGDHINAALVLGQPDEYVRHDGHGCGLYYRKWGFQIEFDDSRQFNFACFLVSPDPADRDRPTDYRPVAIKGKQPLTRDTHEPDIRSAFGKPSDESKDAAGNLITYRENGLILDFTFSPEGNLVEFTFARD